MSLALVVTEKRKQTNKGLTTMRDTATCLKFWEVGYYTFEELEENEDIPIEKVDAYEKIYRVFEMVNNFPSLEVKKYAKDMMEKEEELSEESFDEWVMNQPINRNW